MKTNEEPYMIFNRRKTTPGRRRRRQEGFTLVELLLVLVILMPWLPLLRATRPVIMFASD